MTDPTPLSPAAQAVLDAFDSAARDYPNFNVEPMVAAALRAAALYCKRDNLVLLALAEELDQQTDPCSGSSPSA